MDMTPSPLPHPMDPTTTLPRPALTDRAVLLALLRQEGRDFRGVHFGFIALWLAGLWVLVFFHHPTWLLAIGMIYVLLITPNQAGRDVIDGTEEFAFSLPPGRGPLFLARMLPGLVLLILNGVIGGLAIAFSLPQLFWSAIFSSGLTKPFLACPAMYYGLAIALPVAAHALTFAIAANARGRRSAQWSSFAGIITAAMLTQAAVILETLLWDKITGLLAIPVLLAAAVLALLGGYQFYLRKEAVKPSGEAKGGNRLAAVWISVGLLLLLVISMMFVFKRAQFSKSAEKSRMESTLRSERAAVKSTRVKASEASHAESSN